MCGFVGSLSLVSSGCKSSPLELRRALDTIIRRGPDGEGKLRKVVGDWEMLLGHRRLSIIDLDERASQPFRYANITMVFNGEIYNYIEIRRRLTQEGFDFVTDSDTEVLAVAYHYWGRECFSQFDGMFSVVIIDAAKNTVIFARDSFGEKPLYVSAGLGQVVFGSTLDSVIP